MKAPTRTLVPCLCAALAAGCGLHRIPDDSARPALTPAPQATAVPARAAPAPRASTLPPHKPAPTPPSSAGDAVQDLLRAQLELQKAQTYTGLTDAQLDRLRAGEFELARGNGSRALEMLHALNDELARATRRYVVAAGDSLWIISGRPEVYGNPYLWPLIWDANLDTLTDPNRLRSGQRLRIRANPTIDEVVQAVDRARHYRSPNVRIGEVRETPP